MGSGRPMPTYKLEKVLPDSFGDWKLVNVVRNAGGPPMSEVIGHYISRGSNVSQGLGSGGEIRITVQDWGAQEETPQIPVDENAQSFDYNGIKCYPGRPGLGVSYALRIPVGKRILILIEWEDKFTQDETFVLDAIHWDYLNQIAPYR